MKTSEPGEPKFYNFIIIMFQRNILEEVFSFLLSQFSISSFYKVARFSFSQWCIDACPLALMWSVN